MPYECIRLDREGPLVELVLNRPDRVNALSRQTIAEITEALKEIAADPDARAVIVRAEGRHFSAGHDLSEMAQMPVTEGRLLLEECGRMMQLVHDIPQPVIAQVHGVATAAGCQLVASCDLAVAEEGASFGTPGVRIGLFCSTPMVPLSRAIGRKRAMEMLLTGRMVPAREAADWGLVNRVVPKDQLASETKALALAIVQASPYTLALGKAAFYTQMDLTEATAYRTAQTTMALNLAAEDAREGISAFLEKRKPTWKGR